MAELLKDNIKVERQHTPQEGPQGSQIRRSSQGEVPDLLGWLQCFGTYACVFCEAFPQKRKELWAYQTFLIRESQQCDGEGWRDYNSMFRQQVASAAELEWARVNNSLFAVTFLAQSSGRGKASLVPRPSSKGKRRVWRIQCILTLWASCCYGIR